jgi:hypothetical protein
LTLISVRPFFPERKLQAEDKEQEYGTCLTSYIDAVHIGYAGHVGHVRRGEEAGHGIAKHDGLFEALEKERHDTCTDKNQCKVSNEWLKI